MRSFDVFDTLITRRCIDGEAIWRQMDADLEIPNFFFHRKNANARGVSLRNIYQHLVNLQVIDPVMADALCSLEVAYEQENAIPIQTNINEVRHGDALISDMYLSAADILKLVRSVGMDKQVTVYQSNNGKHTGSFWRSVSGVFKPELHLGDNLQSDVTQAQQHGINGVHYRRPQLTSIEHDIMNIVKAPLLAELVREVRFRRDRMDSHTDVFDLANQLNLPWLFFASEMIYRKLKNVRRPVFLGRDCQLLYKIYNTFYDVDSYYLPFSREVALSQPKEAAAYLKSQAPENAIYIDVSSTGRTWEVMQHTGSFVVLILIFSDQYHYTFTKPNPPATLSYLSTTTTFGKTNKLIEIFNCADHGRLQKITMAGDLPIAQYAPHDMKEQLVESIHQPVNIALAVKKHYMNIHAELKKLSDDELFKWFSKFQVALAEHKEIDDKFKEYYKNDELYDESLKRFR
jgi:hypothetical protein